MIYIPEHYYKRKSNRYGKNVIVFKLIQIQHGYLYIRILFNKNYQSGCPYYDTISLSDIPYATATTELKDFEVLAMAL